MATIKATCPICGDVDLTPRQVHVTVIEAIDSARDQSCYRFECPACHDSIVKEADTHVVGLLTSANVSVTRVEVPAEAREPHDGSPLGYDDLLDFALWLEHHDTLVGITEPVPGR